MSKKPLLGIIAMLLFIGIGLYLLQASDITINGIALKKPPIKQWLNPNELLVKDSLKVDKVDSLKKKEHLTQSTSNTKAKTIQRDTLIELHPYEMDTCPQRILMLGESMIEGLYLAYLKYAKVNHFQLKAKIWYGSRLLDWGKDDTITKLIQAYKPTYIIVSVGANELFIRNIWERKEFVEKITSQLKPYRYVWIGPPIPKRDYGIDSLYKTYNLEGCYYSSKHHKFKRKRDGVHPTKVESFRWADSIAVWIMNKSRYPILLNKKGADSTKTKKNS